MAQPTPLDVLIDLATRNSDDRAQGLGAALRNESSGSKRLSLLTDYRRDYIARFDQGARDGMAAIALTNYYHFMRRLDQAIEEQQRVVEQSKVRSIAARQELSEAERRRLSLVTLRERRLDVMRRVEAKREQHAHDEIASRIATHGAGQERSR